MSFRTLRVQGRDFHISTVVHRSEFARCGALSRGAPSEFLGLGHRTGRGAENAYVLCGLARRRRSNGALEAAKTDLDNLAQREWPCPCWWMLFALGGEAGSYGARSKAIGGGGGATADVGEWAHDRPARNEERESLMTGWLTPTGRSPRS